MNSVTPTDLDVFCGRGSDCYNHEGNAYFRSLVSTLVPQYAEATYRATKTKTVRFIISSVLGRGGRFLQKDKQTGGWCDGGITLAKKKVGHTLRDGALEFKKKKQRRIDHPRLQQLNTGSSDSSVDSAGSDTCNYYSVRATPFTQNHDSDNSSMNESEDDIKGKAVANKPKQIGCTIVVDGPLPGILNESSGQGKDQAGAATAGVGAVSPFGSSLDEQDDDSFLELINMVDPVDESTDRPLWMPEIEQEECLPISNKSSGPETRQVGSSVRTTERSGLTDWSTATILLRALGFNPISTVCPCCLGSATGSYVARDNTLPQVPSHSRPWQPHLN